MGFRFRRAIKIAPGVRLNLSKSGISASIGPKGLTTNIKPGRKTRTTVGLPGSGVSYSFTRDSASPPAATSSGPNLLRIVAWALLILLFLGWLMN